MRKEFCFVNKMADDVDTVDGNSSSVWEFAMTLLRELFTSPLNIALLGVCAYLIYKIFSSRKQNEPSRPKEPELPRMKKRDFTLEQLREYDGRRQDGRLLMAVNFKVFDVTRGKRFYGPDGPYGVFAGKDASRGLATFSLNAESIKDEYDDLSDLNSMQMESIREWEMQFTEKYPYIGRLLRPGETPQDYSDTEDDTASASATPVVSTPTKVPDPGVTHRNVPNTSKD